MLPLNERVVLPSGDILRRTLNQERGREIYSRITRPVKRSVEAIDNALFFNIVDYLDYQIHHEGKDVSL